MLLLEEHRESLAIGSGAALPIAVAAVLVPFRATFASPAAALVLLGVVVAVASLGSRPGGFVAAASASLWFDFFLTPPYLRFAITQRSDLETAISLFVVGVAVTELAARNRHHSEVATHATGHVSLIHDLSELVADGAPADRVVAQAAEELTELLSLRGIRFEFGSASPVAATIEPDGNVLYANLWWGVHQMGLPGREVELPVKNDGETIGRFVLAPTAGFPISLERRVVAVTIADQVGAALTSRRRSA